MADTEGLKNEIEQLKNAIKVRVSKDQICGFVQALIIPSKLPSLGTKEKMALIWHDRPFCPGPGLLLAETILKSDNDSLNFQQSSTCCQL